MMSCDTIETLHEMVRSHDSHVIREEDKEDDKELEDEDEFKLHDSHVTNELGSGIIRFRPRSKVSACTVIHAIYCLHRGLISWLNHFV